MYRINQLPRCLVCLPWAMSFPFALLVRSTVANARVFPCFKTCAVIRTSSPILAAFMYLLNRKQTNFSVKSPISDGECMSFYFLIETDFVRHLILLQVVLSSFSNIKKAIEHLSLTRDIFFTTYQSRNLTSNNLIQLHTIKYEDTISNKCYK